MPGPHLDDTTPEPPVPFTCPACGAVSHHPDDLRFGYCGRCKDFTGEPTDFVMHGDPAFAERVQEMVRRRFETGAYDSQPILLTHEQREQMWGCDLAALRAHERLALSIERPHSLTALRGAKRVYSRPMSETNETESDLTFGDVIDVLREAGQQFAAGVKTGFQQATSTAAENHGITQREVVIEMALTLIESRLMWRAARSGNTALTVAGASVLIRHAIRTSARRSRVQAERQMDTLIDRSMR